MIPSYRSLIVGLVFCLRSGFFFSQSITSFHPNGFKHIPKYDKFELGLRLPDSTQTRIDQFLSGYGGLNPYNPDQITVYFLFNNQTTNKTYKRNGFYFREFITQKEDWIEQTNHFKFRIRFAPPQAGSYVATAYILINNFLVSSLDFKFDVIESSNPGHLLMANNNLKKMQFENGDLFFGVGQGMGYVIDAAGAKISRPNTCLQWYCRPPASYEQYRGFINDLADNKGNFSRLRLDPFDFPVEWPDWKMYSTDPVPRKSLIQCLNNYDHNQRYMAEFDKVIETCEDRGIYVMVNVLLDPSWSTNSSSEIADFNWSRNPYSALLGDNLQGIQKFFTDDKAKANFKKLLYYLNARWGYSTNLAIWEMINETENLQEYKEDENYRQNVNSWICEMKDYLQSFYPWHPVTTGSTVKLSTQPECLDILSQNSYNASVTDCHYDSGNYNQRANNQADFINNEHPFVWGELGTAIDLIDRNVDREFHNTIWATTMMGGIGNGLYWDDFEQRYGVKHRLNFNSLSAFSKKIDWSEKFVSGKDFSEGDVTCRSKKQKKKIYSYWQRNEAKNFAFGWAVNASSTWFSDPSEFIKQIDFDTVSNRLKCVPEPNPYTIQPDGCHPQMHITGLLPVTKYDVEIFDTYDFSNKSLESFSETSDLTGKLKFRRRMPFNLEDPFYPDYSFIARTHVHNRSRVIVYPNPADEEFSIELMDKDISDFTVRIYNELGQNIYFKTNQNKINVSQFSDGFYIIRVSYTGNDKTGKLIIKH